MCFVRVLHGLAGMFVTALMIVFSVVGGGGAVRMRRLFVKFCGSHM